MTSTLSVDGLGVALSGREVLRDVTFSVDAGEFTGLIGSNGAGKTTLLRTILGLQRASAGRVEVEGPSRRGSQFSYVPQKVHFDPDLPMRARDLVELGADGHRLGPRLRLRSRRDLVDEMLTAVGATAYGDARIGRLSGGEQQRILIAHALISKPRVLLLDEPLANLDLGSVHEIVALLHKVTVTHQVALMLTAHEINPLLPVMDRVVYLANGRAATGTVEEVIRGDVLSELYGHHVDVIKLHGRVLVVVGPASGEFGAVPSHPTIEVR